MKISREVVGVYLVVQLFEREADDLDVQESFDVWSGYDQPVPAQRLIRAGVRPVSDRPFLGNFRGAFADPRFGGISGDGRQPLCL